MDGDDLDVAGQPHGVDREGRAVEQQGVAVDAECRRQLVHDAARHARRALLGALTQSRQLER